MSLPDNAPGLRGISIPYTPSTNNEYRDKQKTRSIGTSKPENDKRFNATTRENLRLTGTPSWLNLVVKWKRHLQFAIYSWKSCRLDHCLGQKNPLVNNGVLATWTAQ